MVGGFVSAGIGCGVDVSEGAGESVGAGVDVDVGEVGVSLLVGVIGRGFCRLRG